MTRRTRLLQLVLAAVLLTATLPASPAIGGGVPGTTDDLAMLLQEQLGLDDEQAGRFVSNLGEVGDDYSAFGWGGNADVDATISESEAPWTRPDLVGLNYIQWQDAADIPAFGNTIGEQDGMLMGGVQGGPVPGTTYAVVTAVMDGDIPLGESTVSGLLGQSMLFQQWDFPLRLPDGQDAWMALPQFPDDTWNLAQFVLSLAYGPNPWALTFYAFSGGDIIPVLLSGFVLAYGNVMMLGVEADPMYFGSGPSMYDVGTRFALDVKDAPFNPSRSRVVTAPSVPLNEGSFFPFFGHTIVPGLPGLFDPQSIWPIVGPDDQLWFYVMPAVPWGAMPPDQYFSNFVQIGFFGNPDLEFPDRYFGFQTHKGVSEVFGSGPDGPLTGLGGYLMNDGSLLFMSPFTYDGNPFTVTADGGFLPTEDGVFKWTSHQFTFTPDDLFMEDDPTRHDGNYPVYDLTTGETVTPPPETTSTTTIPATTETTGGSTTVTTQPTGTTQERPRFSSTTRGDPCWWCWGIVMLFLAVLICMLYVWLKTYEWWTCWLPWFLVIFIWVPFLLAGMWWWRPSWWWVPLLAWFPIIGGYTWYWARHRTWWRPQYLYAVGGYFAVLVLGMVLVGAPEWGLLFPVFWVPWVGFYLWFRGARQPWFKPWMWWLAAAYVVWVFFWVGWLTPWWAWWFPVVFFPFLGWWFVTHGYDWKVIHGPKWCWVVPFAFLPFLAWWIPLWGPWWCFVIALFLGMTLFCSIFNHLKEEEWWTCWIPWVIVLFAWVPFLLAGLWFFRPSWWWIALLPWFVLVPWYGWWWGMKRSWWRPWHWYWVLGYLVVAAVAMYVVGAPEWGLLVPVFWLPWVGLYVWYRAMRQPWWKPWMFGLVGLYAVWVIVWLGWLTPWWGWWFPIFFVPFLGWWFVDHGYEWDLIHRKSCWILPWGLLPFFCYMVAIYCIPSYYWGL